MPYRNASAESWNFTVKIKHRNSKETANINYDNMVERKSLLANFTYPSTELVFFEFLF